MARDVTGNYRTIYVLNRIINYTYIYNDYNNKFYIELLYSYNFKIPYIIRGEYYRHVGLFLNIFLQSVKIQG